MTMHLLSSRYSARSLSSRCAGRRFKACPRGVAMLLVLVVLVLTIPIAVGVSRHATSKRQLDDARSTLDNIHELRIAFENHLIKDWLQHESPSVVLPANAPQPALRIVDEQWAISPTSSSTQPEYHARVVITAFDQCGMVSIRQAATRGAPLRRALPANIIQQLDQHPLTAHGLPPSTALTIGLDQFGCFTPAQHVSPFPTFDEEYASTPRLGAYVATHQWSARNDKRLATSVSTININTAPIELIAAALQELGGTGALPAIVHARNTRKLATTSQMKYAPPRAPSSIAAQGTRIVLTSQSSAWAFRCDVTVDDCRRSWWLVYGESARSDSNRWKCVQRLAIPTY